MLERLDVFLGAFTTGPATITSEPCPSGYNAPNNISAQDHLLEGVRLRLPAISLALPKGYLETKYKQVYSKGPPKPVVTGGRYIRDIKGNLIPSQRSYGANLPTMATYGQLVGVASVKGRTVVVAKGECLEEVALQRELLIHRRAITS